MKSVAPKYINVAGGGFTSPYTLSVSSDVEVYTFYGNKTLGSDFAIQASGTPANDCMVWMFFTGSITTGAYVFSIFGSAINVANQTGSILGSPFCAICSYSNSAWHIAPISLSPIIPGGIFSIDGNGNFIIAPGGITNTQVNASAAIAYSKLALSNSITNADLNAAAAIAYTKLALANSILNADINASAAIAYSKLALSNSIVNADVNTAAAIAFSKMAALTASRVLASDGSGVVTPLDTATYPSLTELTYLKGVSSAIQTQLGLKAAITYVDAQDSILQAAIDAITTTITTGNLTTTTVLSAATMKTDYTCDGTSGYDVTLPLANTVTANTAVRFYQTVAGSTINIKRSGSDDIYDNLGVAQTQLSMKAVGDYIEMFCNGSSAYRVLRSSLTP